MNEKITIIFGYRDRKIERVKRSMDSLARQSAKNFKVIFIDYGSTNPNNTVLINLLKNYPFSDYVYNDTRGRPWNRSHALNTGIRLAKTDFIFTADIDMIFKKNFIVSLNYMVDIKRAFFLSVYLMPSHFNTWEKLDDFQFEKSNEAGLGLALIPTEALYKINGYDETYCYWGQEDNDIEYRLKKSGIRTEFYDEEVLMYHQWHTPFISNHENFPEGMRIFTGEYFEDMKIEINRHRQREWGRIFNTNERKTIKYIDDRNLEWKKVKFRKDYFLFWINKNFNDIKQKDTFAFEFEDIYSDRYLDSKPGKLANFFQALFKLFRLHLIVSSEYRNFYVTVFEIRDIIIYFIIMHADKIDDYFFEIQGKKLKVLIVKK